MATSVGLHFGKADNVYCYNIMIVKFEGVVWIGKLVDLKTGWTAEQYRGQ